MLLDGRDRIRTCEGVRQQIYSLPPLSTWVLARKGGSLATSGRPGKNWKVSQEGRKAAGRTRTADLKITNHVLCQLSYGGLVEQGMRQGSGRQSGGIVGRSCISEATYSGPWSVRSG